LVVFPANGIDCENFFRICAGRFVLRLNTNSDGSTIEPNLSRLSWAWKLRPYGFQRGHIETEEPFSRRKRIKWLVHEEATLNTCDLQACKGRQIGFYKGCAGKAERERRPPSRPFSYELLLFAVLMVAIRKHQETHLCLQQHKCVSNHYRKMVGFMDSRSFWNSWSNPRMIYQNEACERSEPCGA